jgi:hypothetical protein
MIGTAIVAKAVMAAIQAFATKADGVDAPRRHLCAKVEVLKHH